MHLRIASLVPSATEILYAIGGGHLLVGRSHECDYPPEAGSIPVLTAQATTGSDPADIDRQVRAQLATGASLYSLNTSLLESLRPDVILTQDLCSVCSIDLPTVQRLVSGWARQPRIVSLNPASFEDVLDSFLTVGEAAGLEQQASRALTELRARAFTAQEYVNPYADGPTVAFLEWTDPLFIGGHWIPQLIERAGGHHPLNPTQAPPEAGAAAGPQQAAKLAGKSIRIPHDILAASDPDILIVCPCGVGLAGAREMTQALRKHDWFTNLRAVRTGRVAIVDGNQMFSRPGPRLVDGLEWLVSYLQGRPEMEPAGFPWARWQ
jgi:iron complex transport system substrate-binding protein